jgi:hypothetical protein
MRLMIVMFAAFIAGIVYIGYKDASFRSHCTLAGGLTVQDARGNNMCIDAKAIRKIE